MSARTAWTGTSCPAARTDRSTAVATALTDTTSRDLFRPSTVRTPLGVIDTFPDQLLLSTTTTPPGPMARWSMLPPLGASRSWSTIQPCALSPASTPAVSASPCAPCRKLAARRRAYSDFRSSTFAAASAPSAISRALRPGPESVIVPPRVCSPPAPTQPTQRSTPSIGEPRKPRVDRCGITVEVHPNPDSSRRIPNRVHS